MKFELKSRIEWYLWFAWYPVSALDRNTGKFYRVWLEMVMKKRSREYLVGNVYKLV
jgi:hypothetical protein